MINIVVFSRDRACQLDLFIRSAKHHFEEYPDLKWNILYTYSNDEYKLGYERLISHLGFASDFKNDNLNFVKETNFKKDLLSLIDDKNDFTVFFVDDIVWKNSFSIEDDKFKIFKQNNLVLCLSLRLHKNLTYCYPAKINMTPPKFDSDNTFRWRGQSGDYGYPMSLDGHFFRTGDILPLLKTLNYNNPNSLESYLAAYPINKPLMMCFENSAVMSIPVNKVQTFNQNLHGNIPANFLNFKFLEGYIIKSEPFDRFKNISCHQEMTYEFEKK